MQQPKPVSFPATIPPSETAIKVHGEGGARLQLDISEADLPAFLPALAMRGWRLSVTVQAVERIDEEEDA